MGLYFPPKYTNIGIVMYAPKLSLKPFHNYPGFIFEGPDGSGKSTLIKKLEKYEKGFRVIHSGGPPQSQLEVSRRILNTYREVMVTPYQTSIPLFDRNVLISELIYSKALNRTPLLSLEDSQRLLKALGVQVIYCKPPDDFLYSNLERSLRQLKEWKTKEQIEKVRENYPKIIEAYDRYMVNLPNSIQINPFDQSYNLYLEL